MFKNFFITAWRNLKKNKTYAFLNITGLAIGVAVCLLIGVWLHRELSFDNFHPNDDQLFRIANTFKSESESFSQAPSGPAFASLPRLLPAVKSSCRCFFSQYKIKIGDQQYVESNVLEVSPNFFQFFGFKLKKGEPLQCLQAANRIVLSEKAAIKYFHRRALSMSSGERLSPGKSYLAPRIRRNPRKRRQGRNNCLKEDGLVCSC